jgi:hypothetical protein
MIGISINLNEENKVINIYNEDLSGDIKLKVTPEVYNQIFEESKPFKYEDNKLVVDNDEINLRFAQDKLAALKEEIAATDYIVIKAMECSINGCPLPENYNSIMAAREDLRAEINFIKTNYNL